ncbi:MAG: hypothetical protein RLZZ214_2930 [Verrucomicrobiota bacterium]|jgi:hypothetical protein
MNHALGGALRKWLDSTQAAGGIEEGNPTVSKLRARIAAVQSDPSASIQQISQLPRSPQEKAANDYIGKLQSTEARRQALEKFSTALTRQNFSSCFGSLVAQQGFDAAREILSSASLTPGKHDLATAAIAATTIGPETKERAEWPLE